MTYINFHENDWSLEEISKQSVKKASICKTQRAWLKKKMTEVNFHESNLGP